jgi:hypothetical protein
MTATKPDNAPPLRAASVWVHQWARRWTRFAFFQLGGETFFLKTNIGRLNVNIDHILDDPSNGTIKVATHLDLHNAMDLDIVRPFELDYGEPWFVTYMADARTTLNRIHANCDGWSALFADETVAEAKHVVPFRSAGQSCLLFC